MATYTDTFTGANNSTLSTTTWITPTGAIGPRITSNAARAAGAYTCAVLHDVNCPVGADQSAKVTIVGAPTTTGGQGVTVRHSVTAKTGYLLEAWTYDDGVDVYYHYLTLSRYNNGTLNGPLATWDNGVANLAGATVELQISGYTLTVLVNGGIVLTYTDTSASKIATGQPGILFRTSTATSIAVDNFVGGDLSVQSVPGSGPFPAGTITATGVLGWKPPVYVVPFTAASLSLSGNLGVKFGNTVGFPAKQLAITGSIGQSPLSASPPPPAPLYVDEFYPTISTRWTRRGTAPNISSSTTSGYAQVGAGFAASIYKEPLSPNQYSEASEIEIGGIRYIHVTCRAQQISTVSSFHYAGALRVTSDDYTGDVTDVSSVINVPSVGPVTQSIPVEFWSFYLNASKIRLECSSVSKYDPVRIRLFINDVLVQEEWDNSTLRLSSGYVGLTSYYDTLHPQVYKVGRWAAGELPPPETPGVGPLVAGVVSIGGSVGQPVAGSAPIAAQTVSLTGDIGAPVSAIASLAAGAISLSGKLGGYVSRLKTSMLYPTFSAFGGLDSYTGRQKGQITADGAKSIGYRLGIGNDGVNGDRVFLTVPASNIVRADIPTDPVAKATLHCTFLTMMSWDYHATGVAANPSGIAFRVRKVVGNPADGMAAELAPLTGSEPTIPAKAIWLSGQTWYDGATRGNPVWECEVDITSLYNGAAQLGSDLKLALECVFTNPKWVTEIVGADPNLAWAQPRIEVHRWGEVGISLTDLDTCTPTIAIAPPVGGTVADIRWGYDEQCTPQGGVYKWYSGREGHAIKQGARLGNNETGTGGFDPEIANPYTFPMLESSTRVHVEIEIDYGAGGALLFKRTWKTPQTFKPKLELKPGLYNATTSPDRFDTARLLDVRGPCEYFANYSNDAWFVLGKTNISAWQPDTSYNYGDLAYAPDGKLWSVKNAGVSGSGACPLDVTGLAQYTTLTDNTVGWYPARSGGQSWSSSNGLAGDFVYGTPGDTWLGYVTTNYKNDYKLHRMVGTVDSLLEPERVPWPSPAMVIKPGIISDFGQTYIDGGVVAWTGTNVHDMGQPWKDNISNRIMWLSSHFVGGQYEVRLNMIVGEGDNGGADPWNAPIEVFTVSTGHLQRTIATFAQPVDLKKLSAVGRGEDWRYAIKMDDLPEILIALIDASGILHFYEVGVDTFLAVSPNSITPITQPINSYIDTQAKLDALRVRHFSPTGNTFSLATSLSMYSLIHPDGEQFAVVGIYGEDQERAMWYRPATRFVAQDGGGFVGAACNFGAFSSSANPGNGYLVSWPTEILPYDSNGHIPGSYRAHISAALADNNLRSIAIVPNGDNTTYGALGVKNYIMPAFPAKYGPAPDADWDTKLTGNRRERVVGRFPTLPTTGEPSAYSVVSEGGIVLFRANGSTLYVQRIQDVARVSEEAALDVGATIESISVCKDGFLPGVPFPVMLKCSDGFRMVTVTIGVDLWRMYLPTWDQVCTFQSGKLTTANIVKESGNQRDPSEVTHLTGHNVFAMGWNFDKNVDGSYHNATPLGMMNEAGWNYIAIHDCQGERIRLVVGDTPAFGGKWRDGQLRAPTYDAGYQQECLGGVQWATIKFSTWWWSTDLTKGWRRVLDGMDYILDGETQGGTYIITMQSPGENLYLAHDLPYDVSSFKKLFQIYRQMPGAAYIARANTKGELLWGKPLDPRAQEPLSQVGRT